MNDFAKTGLFVAGAAGLSLLALLVKPGTVRPEMFRDEGEEFFRDFQDPLAATELVVTERRQSDGLVVKFAIKRDEQGRWTIPSHGGYPADAKDRMGKAAAMFVGLKKDRVVGDLVEQHAQFGVLDPDAEGGDATGRGRRVTMKDKAGNVLADLIVGGGVADKTDFHYVRVPDKKRVYAAKFSNQLSTKFADWIETDLLKAQSWDVTKVVFDDYEVDEAQGTVVAGEKLVVAKDDQSKWTVEGMNPETEEPNDEKLREITEALGQIKIVGVRQKPEGLGEALEVSDKLSAQDRQIVAMMLQERGYFMDRRGKVFSNEGDLIFHTRKGIAYTLRFGEIVPGEGDAVTAGTPDPKPGEKPKDGEKKDEAAKTGNNRFLMVTAAFDESLLKKPSGARLKKEQLEQRKQAKEQVEAIVKAVDAYRDQHEKKLPETLAKLTEGENPPLKELKKDPWGNDYVLQVQGEGFAVVAFGEDKAEGGEGAAADVRSDKLSAEDDLARAAGEWTEHEKQIEEGKKEATSLQKRFGPWYYVIDEALFAKLKPARKDLVKEKAKPAANEAPGAGAEAPIGGPPKGN